MERRNILAPSILAADFASLGDEVKAVTKAGAQFLHIDVMDGVFVPSISFGMPVISSIRSITDCIFDVHLMIEEPDKYIEAFASCGADILTVHAENNNHLQRIIQDIKGYGMKAGVALNPATPLDILDYVLPYIDMVLIMTVNPGYGGQPYIPEMTGKIRNLRKRILDMGLDIDIEVDGGINEKTIHTVLDAGANVIVSGSAVFSGNRFKNVKRMLAEMAAYKEF